METQGKSSGTLIPFQFDTHAVDVRIDDAGAPWWALKDICTVLGLTDPSKVASRLRPHESTTTTFFLDGIPHQLCLVNESGLYRVIMRSNKPEAVRFQDWVFGEVLPSIRKTGQYSATPSPAPQLPSPEETLATLNACKTFLENLGCFDDRDTITFAAYGRCVAATAMQPLLPAGTPTDPSVIDTTQPVLWTSSMRLQYLRYPVLTGAEGDSKRIRIGSLAKKAYEAEYGEAPKKLWDYVRGQQRQVNAYQPERLHVLDQAIETILGAPRLQVVTPT